MSSQIFKEHIPNEILIKLLNDIAVKTEKCYILNNDAYKKGIFNNLLETFVTQCAPYYYLSKRAYLTRKLTYNSFITIIRQICNYNNITYTSQIKYDKSNYDIIYYIYL
jgi:hypothetical protein